MSPSTSRSLTGPSRMMMMYTSASFVEERAERLKGNSPSLPPTPRPPQAVLPRRHLHLFSIAEAVARGIRVAERRAALHARTPSQHLRIAGCEGPRARQGVGGQAARPPGCSGRLARRWHTC
eukprot:2416402-Rhodomonas_salina.4